jgi:hypothetical protein
MMTSSVTPEGVLPMKSSLLSFGSMKKGEVRDGGDVTVAEVRGEE